MLPLLIIAQAPHGGFWEKFEGMMRAIENQEPRGARK